MSPLQTRCICPDPLDGRHDLKCEIHGTAAFFADDALPPVAGFVQVQCTDMEDYARIHNEGYAEAARQFSEMLADARQDLAPEAAAGDLLAWLDDTVKAMEGGERDEGQRVVNEEAEQGLGTCSPEPAALKEIRDRAAAASPGPWMWRGNVDHDDPALSRWEPGHGRVEVLRHYPRERTATDRGATAYAEYLADTNVWDDTLKGGAGDWRSFTEDEIAAKVQHDWVEDHWGEPRRDSRMAFADRDTWFATDARELAVFEVCPEATTRDDPRVYRADIVGIRHPDAEFIAHARQDVDDLLALIDAVGKVCDEFEPMAARNADVRYGADVVLAAVRAALAGAL